VHSPAVARVTAIISMPPRPISFPPFISREECAAIDGERMNDRELLLGIVLCNGRSQWFPPFKPELSFYSGLRPQFVCPSYLVSAYDRASRAIASGIKVVCDPIPISVV
jgi:hypothetical protein